MVHKTKKEMKRKKKAPHRLLVLLQVCSPKIFFLIIRKLFPRPLDLRLTEIEEHTKTIEAESQLRTFWL